MGGTREAASKTEAQKPEAQREGAAKLFESYKISADGIEATITISKKPAEVPFYSVVVPRPEPATAAYLETVKTELLRQVRLTTAEVLDIKLMAELKRKFNELALKLVKYRIPRLTEQKAQELAGRMVQELLGMGDLEFLLHDDAYFFGIKHAARDRKNENGRVRIFKIGDDRFFNFLRKQCFDA